MTVSEAEVSSECAPSLGLEKAGHGGTWRRAQRRVLWRSRGIQGSFKGLENGNDHRYASKAAGIAGHDNPSVWKIEVGGFP